MRRLAILLAVAALVIPGTIRSAESLTTYHPDEALSNRLSINSGWTYWDYETLTSATGAETLRIVRDLDGDGTIDSVGADAEIVPIRQIRIWSDRFGSGDYDTNDSLYIAFVTDTTMSDSIKVKLSPFLSGTGKGGNGRSEFTFDGSVSWAWLRLKNAEGTGQIHAMAYGWR